MSARKGSRCVVPNCKSGYAFCKEKVTLIYPSQKMKKLLKNGKVQFLEKILL